MTGPIAGEQSAFAALTERSRRELHVHCYRMLASFDEAEDAVQETFLRAWRGRESFDGSALFRAWLYRIATNVCLDMARRRSRRPSEMRSFAEERALLERFMDAHERCDAAAALAIAAEDIRITMPPMPYRFEGLEAMVSLLERAFGEDREGDWRLVATQANRMPAAASYLRRPGDSVFRAFKLDVLRIAGGRVAEVTTFGTTLF